MRKGQSRVGPDLVDADSQLRHGLVRDVMGDRGRAVGEVQLVISLAQPPLRQPQVSPTFARLHAVALHHMHTPLDGIPCDTNITGDCFNIKALQKCFIVKHLPSSGCLGFGVTLNIDTIGPCPN